MSPRSFPPSPPHHLAPPSSLSLPPSPSSCLPGCLHASTVVGLTGGEVVARLLLHMVALDACGNASAENAAHQVRGSMMPPLAVSSSIPISLDACKHHSPPLPLTNQRISGAPGSPTTSSLPCCPGPFLFFGLLLLCCCDGREPDGYLRSDMIGLLSSAGRVRTASLPQAPGVCRVSCCRW